MKRVVECGRYGKRGSAEEEALRKGCLLVDGEAERAKEEMDGRWTKVRRRCECEWEK